MICFLCKRNKPVFVSDMDNSILRLPDRVLTPFLFRLKQDFIKKCKYLRFLRMNSRSINICDCTQYQNCHAYCSTAYVLQKQKIFCSNCNNYYRLYAYKEVVLTDKFMREIIYFIIGFVALSGCIYGVV